MIFAGLWDEWKNPETGDILKSCAMIPGRANEARDTLIYAYAALCGLRAVRGLKLERAAAQFENFKAPDVGAPVVAAPPQPNRLRVRRSSWMQR